MSETIYIADSSFFIEDHNIKIKEIHTTESVIQELKSLKAKLKFEAFSSFVIFHKPSEESINKIKEIAKNHGEISLSQVDVEILAIALDLSKSKNVVILSDDYSIQNICKYLGIEYKGISKKIIKKKIKWELYCKICGNKLPSSAITCIYCGSKDVARRPSSD
jgi:UPF0271 protein